MTGGLFFKPNKYTRVIISLNKTNSPSFSKRGLGGDLNNKTHSPFVKGESPRRGKGIYFSDLRKFGWLKLFTRTELAEVQKNLGLDVLSPEITDKYFYTQLQSSARPIKNVLLDQTKFAGIGNIYACDSLFQSKINPQISAKKISKPKAKTLFHNLQKIMSESILHGGSTARDRGYIMPDGNAGSHQDYFLVYGRNKQPCHRCSAKIKRIKQGGRSTFYCPHCQK
jgi:formamidopyrimidine-DNA glycosylase